MGEATWDYVAKTLTWMEPGGAIREEHRLAPDWDRNELFLAAMGHFVQTITDGVPPRNSLGDGIQVLKLALAAKQSLEKGDVIRL
jgi:hypothetical protein